MDTKAHESKGTPVNVILSPAKDLARPPEIPRLARNDDRLLGGSLLSLGQEALGKVEALL